MVTLQTTIRNQAGDFARVREMVRELERARDLPQAAVFDVNVVLDEVLSNILKYAYSDNALHHIHVTLGASDSAIEIRIEDDGRPFDPLALPEPDLTLPLAHRPEGGLGVHFMRKLMDDVQYKRENHRNYLILNKKF